MTIDPNHEIHLDWESVKFVNVRVLKGKLRFRCGTTMPIRNMDFDARRPQGHRDSKKFFPGNPVMWPSKDGFAEAGTPTENFIMPADISRMMGVKSQEGMGYLPDPNAYPAFIAFGFFMAPVEEGLLPGFTLAAERERIATFWGGYKYPKGDGNMMPPMTRIGPPSVPHVELTLLDAMQQPIMVDGEPVVINPRAFFNFDDPSYYEAAPISAESTELDALRRELAELKGFVKGARSGKQG